MYNYLSLLYVNIYLIIISCNGLDFQKHGLFWGTTLSSSPIIVSNGNWVDVDNITATMNLTDNGEVLIMYHLNIEGLESSVLRSPLPRETVKDSLQVRCNIDGLPYRYSSSYTSSYIVQNKIRATLSGIFVATLSSGPHIVNLQWKKLGSQVQEWIAAPPSGVGQSSGYSLAVLSDNQNIWYAHESTDKFLTPQNIWNDLSSILYFTLTKKVTVNIGYILNVQPQFTKYLKDRKQDFLNVRLVIDNQAYVDGATTHGSVSWNPTPGVLSSFSSIVLPAGTHSVKLQWKRLGDTFQSWSSSPSSFDGFASSRNIIVLVDRYDSVSYNNHDRKMLSGDSFWHTVSNANTYFTLYKESAVLIRYALPVTQHGNPNFDANIWKQLSGVQARLLVDGIAYVYSGSSLDGESRVFDTLYGNLPLILPAGEHSIALQWRSNYVNWTTLNGLENGFIQGEQLLTFILSQNYQPTIQLPTQILQGLENSPVLIPGISIVDVDEQISAGIYIELNMSVSYGKLSLREVPYNARNYNNLLVSNTTSLSFVDSISVVNQALLNLQYIPNENWNGEDVIQIWMSDLGNIGRGGSLNTTGNTTITIIPVDNPFTLKANLVEYATEGVDTTVGPIILEDADSANSTFRVLLSAFCGYLSITELNTSKLLFTLGDGIEDQSIDFSGDFITVQAALRHITYSSLSSCNRFIHREFILIKVFDLVTSQAMAWETEVVIAAVSSIPQISSNSFPRWSLSGLRFLKTSDVNNAVFSYLQYPVSYKDDLLLSADSQSTLSSHSEDGSSSQLSVLSTGTTGKYIVSLQFSKKSVTLFAAGYVPLDTNVTVSLTGSGVLPEDVGGCEVEGMKFMATVSVNDSISCSLLLPSSSLNVGSGMTAWLQIYSSNSSWRSNYVPINLYPMPVILDVIPSWSFASGGSKLIISSEYVISVDICEFEGRIIVSATIVDSTVYCFVPVNVFSEVSEVSVKIGSSDLLFISLPFTLKILPDPVVYNITSLLTTTVANELPYLTLTGNWNHSEVKALNPVCLFGNMESDAIWGNNSDIMCYLNNLYAFNESTTTKYLQLCDESTSNSIFTANSSQIKICQSNSYFSSTMYLSFNQLLLIDYQTLIDKNKSLSINIRCSKDINCKGLVSKIGDTNMTIQIETASFLVTQSINIAIRYTTNTDNINNTFNLEIRPLIDGSFFYDDLGIQTYSVSIKLDEKITTPITFQTSTSNVNLSNGTRTITIHKATSYFDNNSSWLLVSGVDFTKIWNSTNDVYCVFGVYYSPAFLLSDAEVICELPPYFYLDIYLQDLEAAYVSNKLQYKSGNVEANLNTNTSIIISPSINYSKVNNINATIATANNNIVLTSVVPYRGSSAGGTTVTIVGSSFDGISEVSCLFGTLITTARVLNGSALECDAPAASAGEVSIGVEVDGTLYGVGLTYEYVTPPSVTRISPSRGPVSGGSTVTVFGSGFSYSDNLVCSFGYVDVSAVFVSASEVQCVTPEHDVGTANVSVSLDGVLSWSDVSVTYSFVNTPVVLSVTPSSGSSKGGTVVKVSGQNFLSGDAAGLNCLFGDVSVSATVLSEESLTCVTPSLVDVDVVDLKIGSADSSESWGSLSFRVTDDIVLTSVVPYRGSSAGGTTVTIVGSSFDGISEVSCFFGTLITTARVLNGSALECDAPAASAGEVSIGVEVDGTVYGVGLTYEYVTPPSVTRISPSRGPVSGGSTVTVFGSGFSYSDNLVCSFGYVDVSAVFVSASEVQCVTPEHDVGTANVSVSLDGVLSWSDVSVTYSFVNAPVVLSVTPSSGSSKGGTVVKVSGQSFLSGEAAGLNCLFGDVSVSATVLREETLTCVTPSLVDVDVVDLKIGSADSSESWGSLSFRVTDDIVLTSVVPYRGSSAGGTTVTILGSSFDGISEASCLFGTLISTARVLNGSALECDAPGASAGEVSIGVEVDGTVYGVGLTYEYVTPPSVTRISPSRGPVSGGSTVTVFGSGFSYSDNLVCSFGYVDVSAVFVSASEVQCVTPEHDVGTANVSVSLDGVLSWSDVSVTYSFVNAPVVLSVTPSSGSSKGGTVVKVSGQSFLSGDAAGLNCLFGDVLVSATVLSEETLTCVTPSLVDVDVVDLKIGSADSSESWGSLSFRVTDDIVLTSVVPYRGSSAGGTTVTIVGSSFDGISEASCLFGTLISTARMLNGSALECDAPGASAGEVSIGVEVDGTVYGVGLTYEYVTPPSVTRISPSRGPVSGGSTVTVFGSGFSYSDNLVCSFGYVDVSAVFVSASEVQCVTPEHDVGTANVSVSLDGVLSWSDVSVTYSFVNAPVVLSVTPSSGSSKGGTVVKVSGQSFLSGEAAGLNCLFGDVSVSATVLSEETLTCVTPSLVDVDVVDLKIDSADSSESWGSLSFRVTDDIVFTSVVPYRGSSAGGTTVTIVGSSFDGISEASCLFGTLISTARMLNGSALECDAPGASAGEVSIGVEVDGTVYGVGLTYEYVTPPSVTRISPSRGPVSGGSTVTVFGSGFSYSDNLVCSFGYVDVSAVFVSASEVQCVTPEHDVGTANVSVSLDGVLSWSDVSVTYSFVNAPVVLSVTPSSGSSKGGTVVKVSGQSFLSGDAAGLNCLFGDVLVSATVLSEETLTCISPFSIDGYCTFRVISVDATLSSSGIVFLYSTGEEITSVSPLIAFNGSTSLINVYGVDFDYMSNYSCRFDTITSIANYKSISWIQCYTPLWHVPSDIKLSIMDDRNHMVLYTTSFSFVLSPVIKSVEERYWDNVLVIEVMVSDSLPGLMDWTCVVDDMFSLHGVLSIDSRMVLCDASSLILSLSSITVSQYRTIYLLDTRNSLHTESYHYHSSINATTANKYENDDIFNSQQNEELEAYQAAKLTDYVRKVRWLELCKSNNCNTSSTEESSDDDESTTDPLFGNSLSSLSSDYISDFMTPNMSYIDLTELSCSVNNNVSCFDMCVTNDGSCTPFDSTIYTSTHLSTRKRIDEPLRPISIPILNSIDSVYVNPNSGSWITARGKYYSNFTSCLLNGNSKLITIVMSSKYLQCFVPAMTTKDDWKLQLSLHSALDNSTSSNFISLAYHQKSDILNSKNLSQIISNINSSSLWFSNSNTTTRKAKSISSGWRELHTSTLVSSITSSICLSAGGCDVVSSVFPVTTSCYFDDNEISAIPEILPAVSSLRYCEDSLIPKNSTSRHVGVTSTSTTDHFPLSYNFDTLELLDVSPIVLVSNSTQQLSIIGTYFDETISWCCHFGSRTVQAIQKSNFNLVCDITVDTSLVPGSYDITIMKTCQETLASFPIMVVGKSKADDVGYSSLRVTGTASSDSPIIGGVSPSSGSSAGGTTIRIWGSSLNNLKYCRFVTARESVIVAADFSSEYLYCKTPPMTNPSTAILSLSDFRRLSWTTISQPFLFFRTPIFYTAQINATDRSQVMEMIVLGDSFPLLMQTFGKVVYTTGKYSLHSGIIVSTQSLMFSNVTMLGSVDTMSTFSISFNGIDFYELGIHVIEEDTVDVDVASRGYVLLDDSTTTSSSSLTRYPYVEDRLTRSILCDGNSRISVPITIPSINPVDIYSCYLGSECIGRMDFPSTTIGQCQIPATLPGTHYLNVFVGECSPKAHHAVVSVTVYCEPQVSVHSLSLQSGLSITASNSLITLTGVNFSPFLLMKCAIDNDVVIASIDSSYFASCNLRQISPGLKVISIFVDETPIFQRLICWSLQREIILDALSKSTLLTSSECWQQWSTPTVEMLSISSEEVRPSVIVRDLLTITPRHGYAASVTHVEVRADGFSWSGSPYMCLFGDLNVTAIFLSEDRILCKLSSPQAPGNVSLSVVGVNSGDSWCCGWFFFRQYMEILSVDPTVINGAGDNRVTMLVRGLDPIDYGMLYCHFDDQVVAAFINSNNSVACVSPYISPTLREVVVSLGTADSSWTNKMSLTVLPTYYDVAIVPRRGSFRGGTTVKIAVTEIFDQVLSLSSPYSSTLLSCLFNDTPSPNATYISNSLLCEVPPGEVGSAVVHVIDQDELIFAVGNFEYEYPANIATLTPDRVMQGLSIDVLLQGSDFRDSTDFSCVIGNSTFITARWLSSTMMSCMIPATSTVSGKNIEIRVSNNKQDLSQNVLILNVLSKTMILSALPSSGYSKGGTVVTIAFAYSYKGPLYCLFDNVRSEVLRVSSVSSICVSPSSTPGVLDFLIIDEVNNIWYSSSFTYVTDPGIERISPQTIAAGVTSQLTISGPGIDTESMIRMRVPAGESTILKCSSSSDGDLNCAIDIAMNDTRARFLDVSCNGVDYMEGLAAVRVTYPVRVVSINSEGSYDGNGGDILDFTASNLKYGSAVECYFQAVSSEWNHTLLATVVDSDVIRCITPQNISLGNISLTLLQEESIIYGPYEFEVYAPPSVISVTPSTLNTGQPTQVLLTFRRGMATGINYQCMLDGISSDFQVINSTQTICLLYPLRDGSMSLYISKKNVFNVEPVLATEIVVIDAVNDIVLNSSAISVKTTTFISVVSPSCQLPLDVGCLIVDTFDLAQSITNVSRQCMVICEVKPTGAEPESTVNLRICLQNTCDLPFFSSDVTVLSSLAVLAASPSSAVVLGGTDVILLGAGFVNDASMQCVFGSERDPVPAFYISSTSIRCRTPSSSPGSFPVAILRKGIVVSEYSLSFEFQPAISIDSLNVDSLSSLGGTLISIEVPDATSILGYYCHIGDQYVPIAVINENTLTCVSPPLNLSTVSFSLTVGQDGDISDVKTLAVFAPPSVLFLDPTMLHFARPIIFNIVMSNIAPHGAGRLLCFMDGIAMETIADGTVLDCTYNKVLNRGDHILSLSFDGVVIFQQVVPVVASLMVADIYPLIGFTSTPTMLTLTSATIFDQSSSIRCCFGQATTPAMIMSSTELSCFTPVLASPLDSYTLEIGVMEQTGGQCENIGFVFRFVDVPEVDNVSLTNGPFTGGSIVEISFKEPIDAAMHCRIGFEAFRGERLDLYTLLCVTRYANVGIFPIELSLNGRDFVASGFNFEYLPLMPLTDPLQLRFDSPEVTYISPVVFPAGRIQTVHVYGNGFRGGAYCIVGNGIKSSLSILVSSSELECLLAPHIPATTTLKVLNEDQQSSNRVEVKFDVIASLHAVSGVDITPASGPRIGGTSITVYGSFFDQVSKTLLCLIYDNWSYATSVRPDSVVCITPSSSFSGEVRVQLGTSDRELLPGYTTFRYIDDPMIFGLEPSYGIAGTEILVRGIGYTRFGESLKCVLDETEMTTAIVSDSLAVCIIPEMKYTGTFGVTFNTNGQHYIQSGVVFEYTSSVEMYSLWPYNGPALRGGTIVTIYGAGFPSNIDVSCVFGSYPVPAFVISSDTLKCRTPSHIPERVKVSIVADGSPLVPLNDRLEFVFVPDVSVTEVTPNYGYTSGEYPVFVFGSNFINTTSLGCAFADMRSRGIFLSSTSLLCLAPSPLGRSELKNSSVTVEVTVNGYDFSESGVLFNYTEPCDAGFFCQGMTRELCPNGTYCPQNSRNFTLCDSGYFQPREGQEICIPCPVGYFCPDLGLSRPILCPAGYICDTMGLITPQILCPAGQYCLAGTKAKYASEFENDHSGYNGNQAWTKDNTTGVISFNESAYDWSYTVWPYPANGISRTFIPPEPSCDGLSCSPGSTAILAEMPFPCLIGHYCRAGTGSLIPLPKNFSTPQRCFDGFFCPRGSVNPEGSGPCPTGYFCPTQVDAILCPQGHYCPGVGNKDPIECYPGTYNPTEGRSNCTVCPAGTICPGWGGLLPEICPEGFVCAALGMSFPVLLCPAGYYCSDGTMTMDPASSVANRPKPCSPGVFCLGGVARDITVEWIPSQPWGATGTQPCVEGTYCAGASYQASGTGLCFLGHYCPPGSSFPTETPIGNYASKLGSVAPTLCYPGTYAPLKGQVDCDVCPAGYSCASYGTYKPAICAAGKYRSLADSVTCRLCPTGTYQPELGATDISLCYPCPERRVCAKQAMTTLAKSEPCPAGYTCGFGTDRSRQFLHESPAGFYTGEQSAPSEQFDHSCDAGYYCQRGTEDYLRTRNQCKVLYYCPPGTTESTPIEQKCPRSTTSSVGSVNLTQCLISPVNLCDKQAVNSEYPMEDLTYYSDFSYTPLNGDATVTYDSTDSTEIVSVRKIVPINVSTSSPQWMNDTIEAFRACPSFGEASDSGDIITVIGRNFRKTGLNFCRWRACLVAEQASADSIFSPYPRRCKNKLTGQPIFGNVSSDVYINRAVVVSSTRMICKVPHFLLDNSMNHLESIGLHNRCQYINTTSGEIDESHNGNFSYLRECSSTTNCMNKPYNNWEYLTSLILPCTDLEVTYKVCSDRPRSGYMFNPCKSSEVLVEVTNDGIHYTGGDSLTGLRINATVQESDTNLNPSLTIYENFADYLINATAAVYTFIPKEYYLKNTGIHTMEARSCEIARYSEEASRDREGGVFMLMSNQVAHVQVDLTHIPTELVYGEHYLIALLITPSRCESTYCTTTVDYNPCKLPANFPNSFTSSPTKNIVNNFTVYALDDMIFKIEIQLLYGLFLPYDTFFYNTTTVKIVSPSRAKITKSIGNPVVRQLSPYVSFEERRVIDNYFFGAVYKFALTNSFTQPYNVPPMYSAFATGRALIMYNVSEDTDQSIVPIVYSDAQPSFQWTDPSTDSTSALGDAKELIDGYFETFHEMSVVNNEYDFQFTKFIVPYLLYFSNCRTYDRYIPIWMLFESEECYLPDRTTSIPYITNPPGWRYKYPALVDQDAIRPVGPYDLFETPLADWCVRNLTCNYEESLSSLDNYPRWFEASTTDEIFYLLNTPIDYAQYTGRSSNRLSAYDRGGGPTVDDIVEANADALIAVTVNRDPALSIVPTCTLQCFPRTMRLDIGYYQETVTSKRIIFADLYYLTFDFDSTNTNYDLSVIFHPLDYLDLINHFAFEQVIFVLIFIAIGTMVLLCTLILWIIMRLTTHLQNPPEPKFFSVIALTAPPPAAGCILGIIPAFILLSIGYALVSGNVWFFDMSAIPSTMDSITIWYVDSIFPLTGNLALTGTTQTVDTVDIAMIRAGRIGTVFLMVGICSIIAGSRIFIPKTVVNLAIKSKVNIEKEKIWDPTEWKRMNFILCSIILAILLVMIVEFSFWQFFGLNIFWNIYMLKVFARPIEMMMLFMLKEELLVAPLKCALLFVMQIVTLGAPDFSTFLSRVLIGYGNTLFERIYFDPTWKFFLQRAFAWIEYLISMMKIWIPKRIKYYLKAEKLDYTKEENNLKKKYWENLIRGREHADTVEPILRAFCSVCVDTCGNFYYPFMIFLFIKFRYQIVLPVTYGIGVFSMVIYLYFEVVIIVFYLLSDVVILSCLELFHGWKIYEYLVYSRYRFLQRETRWKGMEDSLDECIEEEFRTLDQMCFSSQFYMMLMIHFNGIIFVVLAIEIYLRQKYNFFQDTFTILIILFLFLAAILLEWCLIRLALLVKLWKIKHENTAWHQQRQDEDDMDIPGWDDLKGASHDAYLMNQRITSDTFRYKFLNYNRAWLIQQLPQLLTPRTLRRSRPYLINQLARIIHSKRDDISDDSDKEDKQFGPVALSASSRNIIRWWLAKARKRQRLRQLVEPLIRKARGVDCEQCLSRKQLQVEYETDLDQMIAMYESMYPEEEEVDQVQWKAFWTRKQVHHTICLACLTRRKDALKKNFLPHDGAREPDGRGRGGTGKKGDNDDQEDYPDWGPVFLTAASKAILLNWYRKAQLNRAGKKARRRDKVVKDVSDDEGEDVPADWAQRMYNITPASKAIAVKWMRTARAQLQRKAGKGSGVRDADDMEEEAFKSGKKSRLRKK